MLGNGPPYGGDMDAKEEQKKETEHSKIQRNVRTQARMRFTLAELLRTKN